MSVENTLKNRVEYVVGQIPKGRAMTYGQIAALCGSPRAARVVGGIAHFGDPELPWHRVVSKNGGLAVGYPGGRPAHQKHLEQEEIIFLNGKLDIAKLLWSPSAEGRS